MMLAIGLLLALATLASSGIPEDVKSDECLRPCVPGESRLCSYRFFVSKAIESNGSPPWRLINGKSPGPSIEICLGDTVEVVVKNALSSEELSFHWHGLKLKGTPHMDGVSMLSQCPIFPYNSFRYEFKPDRSGTYMYYAHSVRQQVDGLYGSLIVRDSENDASFEKVLLISATASSSLSELVNPNEEPAPLDLLLNGQFEDVIVEVKSGSRYLLRLANANAFNCPISFSIAGHKLSVAASDGYAVAAGPATDQVIIFPGERFDLSLETSETPGRFLIAVTGLEECRGLIHRAILSSYDEYGTPVDGDEIARNKQSEDAESHCELSSDETKSLCWLHLRGNDEAPNELPSEILIKPQTIYIPFDMNLYENVDDLMSDYSFNIYEHSYYPAFLSVSPKGRPIGQINRMSFEYPSSPLLSQQISEEDLCSVEKRAKNCHQNPSIFCQCTQILRLPAFQTFDIVFIDEGFGSNISHTFHVHGYSVAIVDIGQFETPKKLNEVLQILEEKSSKRDFRTALVRKDTFVVPNKGYLVLRIHTDNIGYWLWEARSTGLHGGNDGQPPMQFAMLVGNRENLPPVPIDFPTCGDRKGPASIFDGSDWE